MSLSSRPPVRQNPDMTPTLDRLPDGPAALEAVSIVKHGGVPCMWASMHADKTFGDAL
ncbi:hypothetical protein [Caenispirillum salinarum]|nr:hypothetical protein [Caenispirillum salinarum]